ncbi:MAG: RluA family pseudouridine synthase [Magnetococcales bacterium]|nr:RluA family pseudouridine synthase [Magnetococcales bacterium]
MIELPSSPVHCLELTIPPALAGLRLDAALASLDHTVSRTGIQRLIESGAVTRSGTVVLSIRERAQAGQCYRIVPPPPRPAQAVAQAIPLVVLYEDDHVIVIDKPAGLVVHPGAGAPDGTLVNALLHHCRNQLSGIGGVERPGIVHRLDKETSGVLVAAKSDQAHQALAAQFQAHTITRRYQAIVKGCPAAGGTIDAPIGRDPHHRTRMAVTTRGGRQAVTHWRLLERFTGFAHIQCRLETGRTHQIRVHMAHIRHPLLGDPLYARPFIPPSHWPRNLIDRLRALDRQALHAELLEFDHPRTGERLRFQSPPPADFAQLLENLHGLP